MLTFPELAERVAARGESAALSFEGRSYGGREVVAEARRLARALLAIGVTRGDRVCLWVPNCPEFVFIELAVTLIGAILVPIQSRYGATELGNILERAVPAVLFIRSSFPQGDLDSILERACPDIGSGITARVPSMHHVISIDGSRHQGVARWREFLTRASEVSDATLDDAIRRVRPNDPAVCIFTSGTTGVPKGAMLSHAAILSTESSVGNIMRFSPDERVLYGAPLPSVFGCCNALVASWLYDACLVVLPTFEAREALAAIERERCNVIYGVPTMYLMLLNHPDFKPSRTASLRSGIVGGAPCPPQLADAIIGRLGVRDLVSGYGMSETCAVITITRIGDPVEIVTGTVGRPLPGVEVRICDPASPDVLPPESDGEICVRGSNLMLGYFDGRDGLRKPFTDGWFRTGDLGVLGHDGNVRITGRVSDMMLVGGFNVYPVEIETLLSEHPDVLQAHVVGVEDERMGELPVAFVQLRAGGQTKPNDLMAFCAERIAKYKIPTRFLFVENFPMTPLGKIQKFELKKMAKQAFV